MVYLAQSQYLLLLLLIPLLFVGYALFLRMRRKRIARFGDEALVRQLMPNASTGKGWLKISKGSSLGGVGGINHLDTILVLHIVSFC